MPLELVLNANCDMCNHFELPCLCMLASWQCHSRCSCVWSLRMFDDGGSQRFLFGAASPPRKVTRTERTILMLCFFYIYRKHIYDFTGNCSLKRLHYKHWLGQPSSFRWFGWWHWRLVCPSSNDFMPSTRMYLTGSEVLLANMCLERLFFLVELHAKLEALGRKSANNFDVDQDRKYI